MCLPRGVSVCICMCTCVLVCVYVDVYVSALYFWRVSVYTFGMGIFLCVRLCLHVYGVYFKFFLCKYYNRV